MKCYLYLASLSLRFIYSITILNFLRMRNPFQDFWIATAF